MKEELISVETAKLAYEKGFTDFHAPMPYLIFDDKYRPTQSLLQKWLREEHNLEVCIKPIGNYSPDSRTYSSAVMSFSFGKNTTDTLVIFRGGENRGFVYEEVLEKGLQEALKLLKQ